MKSLGLIEVSGVTAAITALDTMCKTANVELVTWQRRLGGRLVTVIVQGGVSDVTQAIDSAALSCPGVKVHAVIPNPHEETVRILELCKAI